jgi:uncharacterized protein YfbU (UPF0304 family)
MTLQERFPENKEYPALIKAIEKSYDYFYEDVRIALKPFYDVSQLPELEIGIGEATCDLVVRVLGLYKEFCCAQNLHGKDEIPDDLIAFRGFDLETENKHFHFCCFMLEYAYKIDSRLEYSGITSNPFFRDNYHGGIVPYYKEMLKRAENTLPYNKCNVGAYLSPKEVRCVVGFNRVKQ